MEPNVREQRININGLTIHYYESAAAEGQPDIPLVLLHGTGESAFDWSWVLPHLCSQYRVYAPSFPGAGESSKPDRAYSIDFLTRFVLEFLSALNLEQAILVGNSLGGLVSLRMALNYPAKVPALVLVDSAGLGPYVNPLLAQMTLPVYGEVAIAWSKFPVNAQLRVRARTTLMYANPQNAPEDWLAMQDKLTQTPGFLEATLSSLRALSSIFGQHTVLLDDLPQLAMPTLIIWGEDDLILPKHQAQAAVKRIPQGQISIIPQAGHMPQIEQPDLFLAALKPFLNRAYTEA